MLSDEIRLHVIYTLVVGVVALVTNLLLLYLVIYWSRVEMKAYRAILLSGAAADLFFTALNLLTLQAGLFDDGVMILMNLGVTANLPKPWPLLLTCGWLFAMTSTYATLCFQVGFRYNIIVPRRPFSPVQLGVAYGSMIGVAALLSVLGTLCYTSEDLPTAGRPYSAYVREHNYVIDGKPVAFTASDSKGRGAITLSANMTFSTVCYSLISYFVFNIRRTFLSAGDKMRPSARRVQRQIDIILFVQLSVPLVLVMLPVSVSCGLTLFGINAGRYAGELMIRCVSLIPLSNALTVICVVPSYRRAVAGTVMSWLCPWLSYSLKSGEVTSTNGMAARTGGGTQRRTNDRASSTAPMAAATA